jgi:tRNA threonylcarbamoyladenosine biosynthesis protein TsaB
VLAFDTSTECMAVAACGPLGSRAALAPGGAAASASLLPLALQVLAAAGLQWRDLHVVAFGCGPGAFTGLRTSCAVAQGLALGLNVPVLPIDSLLLVAEDARQQVHSGLGPGASRPWTVDVVMDARMNEVYAGRYRWEPDRLAAAGAADITSGCAAATTGLPSRDLANPAARRAAVPPDSGGWQVLEPPRLLSLAGLAAQGCASPSHAVAGSALVAFAGRWVPPPQAQHLPAERNRAAALLHLALQAWAAGEAVDAAHALPLYGRDKVAQTTAEREQARAALAPQSAAPAAAGRS